MNKKSNSQLRKIDSREDIRIVQLVGESTFSNIQSTFSTIHRIIKYPMGHVPAIVDGRFKLFESRNSYLSSL